MQVSEVRELPFVSIVICTYNRKNFLKDCLNSIFAMEYPQRLYEVIVVDGGSTDGTADLCKEFPNIRFVVEDKHGLAYARNKGADLAHGNIVAYTDDDCIVDKKWLRNLVVGFKLYGDVIGIGGPVYPLNPDLIPQKIYVKAAFGLFDEGEKVKLVKGVITSNAAFKREIFKKIQFDEKLGTTRRGKLILSGEDVDFCQNIINSGYKLLYMPNAKVYHQIPLGHIRTSYVIKRAIHSGISVVKFLEKEKNSRMLMFKLAVGKVAQSIFATLLDKSFVSCYKLLESLSALLICLTCLDTILLNTKF